MGWLSDALFQFSNVLAGLKVADFFKDDDEDGPVSLQVGKKTFHNVPRAMRTELWLSQLHRSGGMGDKASIQFKNLLHVPLEETVSLEIEKDLHRTFPSHRQVSSPEGQQAMRGVLHAYAAFDPEIGYTQGLNFIAALLLTYIPNPAKAFGALVVLMQDRGLRQLYIPDMSLLQIRLWQLGRLMPPSLATHMESQAALPVLFAPSWFMTCFASDFPLHFSSRVMDLIITTDASSQTVPLVRIALALLEAAAPDLMQLHDLEDVLGFLKHDVPRWSRERLQELISNALEKPWSKRQMKIVEEMNGAESVADAVKRVDAALVGQHTTSDSGTTAEEASQQREPTVESTLSGQQSSKAAILESINTFQELLIFRNQDKKEEQQQQEETHVKNSQESDVKATAPATTTTMTNSSTNNGSAADPRAMMINCLPSPNTLESLPREWAFIDPSKNSIEIELDPGLSSKLSIFAQQQGGAGDDHHNTSSSSQLDKEEEEESFREPQIEAQQSSLRLSPFDSTNNNNNNDDDNDHHHHKSNLSMMSQEFGSFKAAKSSASIDRKEEEVKKEEELSSEVKALRLVEVNLSQLRSSLPLLQEDSGKGT